MVRLTFFATILFVLNINHCLAQEIPGIGQTWAGEISPDEKLYVLPPYGFQDKIVFKAGDINFFGAVKSGRIVFISTHDPGFVINGKSYVGTPLSSFKNRDELVTSPGWGSYLKIDDEWYAAFDYKELSDASKVVFVFKYNPPKSKIY